MLLSNFIRANSQSELEVLALKEAIECVILKFGYVDSDLEIISKSKVLEAYCKIDYSLFWISGLLGICFPLLGAN